MSHRSETFVRAVQVAIAMGLAMAVPEQFAAAGEMLERPDLATLQKADKRVRDVYGEELAHARQPQEKAELARKFVQLGIEEQKDAAARFALFSLARDISIAAGDLQIACQAIDAMDGAFKVDALSLKVDAAASAARAVRSTEARREFCTVLDPLVQKALEADRYEVALRFAEAAQLVAHAPGDAALSRQAAARLREVHEADANHHRVQAAEALLKKKPLDPEANLTLGRYRCLVKGDWTTGLPMLARGSDAALKKLAERELANATSTEDQLSLGDTWWELAEVQPVQSKAACYSRAVYWYALANPQLAGLERARIAKRLATAASKGSTTQDASDADPLRDHTPLAPVAGGKVLTGVQEETVVTLSAEAKPYLLQGEYRVPEGKQLEIEAGVVVVCMPRSHLVVNGSFIAAGTIEKPVEFRGIQRQPGCWKGILLEGMKDTSLKYARVYDAETGLSLFKCKSVPLTGCILANNNTGFELGHYSSDSHSAVLEDCVMSFNKSHGVVLHGATASFTACTISKNGGLGIEGAYYVTVDLKNSVLTLNNGGGIQLTVYDCKVSAEGCVLFGNKGLDVNNRSTPEWDLRGNYWGPSLTTVFAKRGITGPLPNVTGKMKLDGFLVSMPKQCGASIKELNRQKLW